METLIKNLNSQFKDYLIIWNKNSVSVYNGSKAFEKYCLESFTFSTKSLVSDVIRSVRRIIKNDMGITEFAKRFNLK